MVAAPKLTRLTVAEAVETYLASVDRAVAGRSLSKATAENYRRYLGEFVELAGPTAVLDDLSAENVDDIVLMFGSTPDQRFARTDPTRTRGAGSMVNFRAAVSRLFTEAVVQGWVESSPMPTTRVRPKAAGMKDPARKALGQNAAEALLDSVAQVTGERKDQDLRLRDEFLLRLLVECGPRVSEVCSADQSDLSRSDDGVWWLTVTGKGNKTRELPVSALTVEMYQTYLSTERPPPRERTRRHPESGEWEVTAPASDAEQALLLSWRGRRITPRDVQLLVKRYSSRLPADVRRRVTPHGLRHTAATLLLVSGAADVMTVKELLGHSSVATTSLYLDADRNEMAAAVRAHPVTGERRRPSGASRSTPRAS